MTIRPRFTVDNSCLTPYTSRLMSKGFTLIEIIVVLAVISILVAILTPTVLKFIEEAQEDRALADTRGISAGLNDLIKDTGQFPGNKTSKSFLCGTGDIASDTTATWATSSADCSDLSDHLIVNDPDGDGTPDEAGQDYRTSGKRRYRGPYVQSLNEDPWGNAYEVYAATLKGGNTNPTWVISAGPDAIIQTATTNTTLSGDDLGIRIK